MKIAIIGSGISGITAAYLLDKHHEVHLFEKNDYLGGHTNTRYISDGPDKGLAVDTGFIVCNPVNYPNFYRLLSQLEVRLQPSEMSFGYQNFENNFSYLGPTFREFLRNPAALLNSNFVSFIWHQRKFNRELLRALQQGTLATDKSLGQYLKEKGVSAQLTKHYIAPLVASIWSSPDIAIEEFPLATFATFFRNHGMLEFSKQPKWETLVGGSIAYIHAFRKKFSGRIFLNRPVQRVVRSSGGVTLSVAGESLHYDKVVFASHADQTLALLADLKPEESIALTKWRYNKNQTTLHSDSKILGKSKKLWAAWNYRGGMENNSAAPTITYYMNRLQRLRAGKDYFVTLNQEKAISPNSKIYEINYEHPVYTPKSIEAQESIRRINGAHNTFFCGAYLGYGFHEDGVNSALRVIEHFGLTL